MLGHLQHIKGDRLQENMILLEWFPGHGPLPVPIVMYVLERLR